jgi:hypothetical protein
MAMERALILATVLVGIAARAEAGAVTVTPDHSGYTVGQTIILTVVGDPQGGSAIGIWGRLLYSAALTNPSGIAPIQNTNTISGSPATVGPLHQGVGYAGYGYSDAFNQLFSTSPVSVDQNTTATIKLIAAAEGTVDFFWEKQADGLGNYLVYFGTTPSAPAATVQIVPEPGIAVPLVLGVLGIWLSPRRSLSVRS